MLSLSYFSVNDILTAICRSTSQAVVFNTYQTYLQDAYNEVKTDLEQAERQNFYFGAKLVRGAYIEQVCEYSLYSLRINFVEWHEISKSSNPGKGKSGSYGLSRSHESNVRGNDRVLS